MFREASMLATKSLILSAVMFGVLGCSGGGGKAGEPAYEENAVVHQVTEADKAKAQSREPLAGSGAVLYVNGLGCPLCATNIDKQLARVKGVSTVDTDLSHGLVTVGFGGPVRPSSYQLSEAVADSGFTLVKIESR